MLYSVAARVILYLQTKYKQFLGGQVDIHIIAF